MHIFTAGQYGDGDDWSRERLQQVVDNFNKYQKPRNPEFPFPPAVYASREFAEKLGYHGKLPVDQQLGRPPVGQVGIGHEEDQGYLRFILGRSDIPAAGWPSDIWLEGDKLYANIENMPVEVASLIESGLLPTSSAEFYNEYHGYGPVLRRIALLGGEIPRVKGMEPTPQFVQHSENTDLAPGSMPYVSFFTEMRPAGPVMDRNALLVELARCGMDIANITDGVPDNVLREMLEASRGKFMPTTLPAKPETIVTSTPASPTPATPMPTAPAVTNSEHHSHHAEHAVSGHESPTHKSLVLFAEDGETPRGIQHPETGAMVPFDPANVEHNKMYAEHCMGRYREMHHKFSEMEREHGEMKRKFAELEGQIPPSPTPKSPPTKDHEPSEHTPVQFTEKMMQSYVSRAVQAATAPLIAQANQLKNVVDAQAQQLQRVNSNALAEQNRLRREKITSFCEKMRDEGRIEPKVLLKDQCPGGITLIDEMMELDDSQKVAKFGERQITRLEAKMVEIGNRPKLRVFTEKMAQKDAETMSPDERTRLLKMSRHGQTVIRKEKEALAGKK